MARLTYDPDAVLEIKDAALYYEEKQQGLGAAFVNEVELAVYQGHRSKVPCLSFPFWDHFFARH